MRDEMDYVDYVDETGPFGLTGPRLVVVILLLLLAFIMFCAFDILNSSTAVMDEAQVVMDTIDDMKDTAKAGDFDHLQELSAEISGSARKIRGDVHSPAWFIASFVPVVGQDVHSVQPLSDVFVDLADNALVPIASNPAVLNYKDIFNDGTIDVAALEGLASALEDVQPVISRCSTQVADLPEAHVSRLAEVLPKVQGAITSAGEAVDTVQSFLPHLNYLLGSGGTKRNYLVVAFTNAELRSAGGFPGSWTLVTVENGKISMGKTVTLQHKADDFLQFRDDEKAAFPGVTGNMGSIPFLPDFTRVGALMAQGYEHHRNVHIDGVIAIDPVFLQRVLSLTGGVTASDGTLVDGTNAAWELMSNAYWRFGNEGSKQDQFFAEVASLSFNMLTHNMGKVGLANLFSLISDSAADHRFQGWMENEAVQQIIEELGFSGKVPDDPFAPVLGIYLNDNTWAKIGWYAKLDTQVSEPTENVDGSKTYEVVTTITNSAWSDELEYSPRYVWGYNWDDKRTDTDMILFPLIMAPAGGRLADMHTNGYGGLSEYTLYGLNCVTGVMHADVGESIVLSYKVITAPEATEPLQVRETPLAQERLLSIEYDWER